MNWSKTKYYRQLNINRTVCSYPSLSLFRFVKLQGKGIFYSNVKKQLCFVKGIGRLVVGKKSGSWRREKGLER
jgi:hypothetical protein